MKDDRNKANVSYDEKSDTLYIITKKGPETEFIELAPNINVELDKDGRVIGLEILHASEQLNPMVEKLRKAV